MPALCVPVALNVMYRLYCVPDGKPAVGMATGIPLLKNTDIRKNPDSVNAVPAAFMSMFAYVLINTLSKVNAGAATPGIADGFQVTSIGVSAAFATLAPVNNIAANSTAKYFLSCILVP